MEQEEKRSRSSRRILGIIIAILAIFVLYAYAIDVTDINFVEPQDPQRQAVTTRVVRALARPDIFIFNEETRSMNIGINMPCEAEISDSEFSLSDGRTAIITPNCASTTQDQIIVTGTGFRPTTAGIIRWYPPGEVQTTRALSTFRTDDEGAFTADFTFPDIRPSDDPQRIELEESWSSGGFLGTGIIGLSNASLITIEKIVETVLLALMATTIGTLLAVPIAFLSARNLMENVGLPLASIMAAIIGFVAAFVLGWFVTTSLLGLAATLTNDSLTGIGIIIGLLLLAVVVVRAGPKRLSEEEQSNLSLSIEWLRIMLVIVIVFFAIGLIAYLAIVFGDWLEPRLGGAAFLARFISFLAEGVTVLSAFVVGFLASLIGASLGSTYGQEAILRVSETPGRIITGIIAGIGSTLFVFGIAYFLNWLLQFDNPDFWLRIPALIAGIIMLVVGIVIQPRRPFPIGFVLYSVFRFLLNVIRSIEPLIYVIVFAVWVGIGPFAGVMALTIHTIAALGKLFSEQVESIAEGPVEAITATGASRLQMVVYAVIPQIVPPFIAFTLYRWDINVRFSTVIGFAGGGGIGFVLVQNINLLQYRQAAVMMIAIALVVWALDYASSKIRSRII